MLFDYATLKIIWWFLIGVLFLFFVVLGGRDIGACIWLPILTRKDTERRVIINSIGPTWEANQVWFITAAGAIFAAWPIVYAAAFSALYLALFLVLITFIIRPPGFDFRSKLPNQRWRSFWDYCLGLSGWVPALVFGVALGNVLRGVPFHFDELARSYFTGSFFKLLHPFCLLMGLATFCAFAMHGAAFIVNKCQLPVLTRLRNFALVTSLVFVVSFAITGLWILMGIKGYVIDQIGDLNSALIPPQKNVIITSLGWFDNFYHHPVMWSLPISVLVFALFYTLCMLKNNDKLSYFFSSLVLISAFATFATGIFPFILPSSTHPDHSLTIWDAVSSHRTLQYMFYAVVIFLPLILIYSRWVFKKLSGPINESQINNVESY